MENNNILVWNCTGARKKISPSLIEDMKRHYKASFVVLMETRISGVRAAKVVQKLDFDGHFMVEAEGFTGDIWVL